MQFSLLISWIAFILSLQHSTLHLNLKHQTLIHAVVFRAIFLLSKFQSGRKLPQWRPSLHFCLFLHSAPPSYVRVFQCWVTRLKTSICNALRVSPSIRRPSNFPGAIIFCQKHLFICNAWLPVSVVSWLMVDWCFLWLCNDFVQSVYYCSV